MKQRLRLFLWFIFVGHIKGSTQSWSVKLTFQDGTTSGTNDKVYGNIIGSRSTCGEVLLNNVAIPSGQVLTTTMTCPSDIGKIKSFTIRTTGNDGADLIGLEVKNSVVTYVLLEQTSHVGLFKEVSPVTFPATEIASFVSYMKHTDGNLGALITETTKSPPAGSTLDCARRCRESASCEAFIMVDSECELRKYNDGSQLGTKTYSTLKYLKRTDAKPYR